MRPNTRPHLRMSLPKGHDSRLLPDDSGCPSLNPWPAGGDILPRLDILGARVQPSDDTLTVLVIETMSRGFASPMATRKTDRY